MANTGVPNPARIYDYLLDGKDNFPADRDVAEQLLAIAPVARDVVDDKRALLRTPPPPPPPGRQGQLPRRPRRGRTAPGDRARRPLRGRGQPGLPAPGRPPPR